MTKADTLTFLRQNMVLYLSTTVPNEYPESALMLYVIDDDFTLYCITRSNTRKFQNILKNPKVAWMVYDQNDYTSVQAHGTAKVVDDLKKQTDIVHQLWKKATNLKKWPPPFQKMEGGDYKVIQIKTTWLRWADFHKIETDDSHYFEEIIH